MKVGIGTGLACSAVLEAKAPKMMDRDLAVVSTSYELLAGIESHR